MISFVKRNLLVFFRDKSGIILSLLTVFVIVGLYGLFLGDMLMRDVKDLTHSRFLMDGWVMSGLLAITPITAMMCALQVMVDDKVRKIVKDFGVAPITKKSYVAGYILSAFIISCLVDLIALVLLEIYVVSNGGNILTINEVFQTGGLILLSTLASTSMVFFAVSFLKSQNVYAIMSTLIGILAGFVTGTILPVGMFPESVQWVVRLFPISHAAALFRQVIMDVPMRISFSGAGVNRLEEFKEYMGITYKFGDYTVSTEVGILILVLTSVLFYGLSVINISRKAK